MPLIKGNRALKATVTLRITPGERKRLKTLAREKQWTLSQYVLTVVRDHLKKIGDNGT